jgi:predicted esterase
MFARICKAGAAIINRGRWVYQTLTGSFYTEEEREMRLPMVVLAVVVITSGVCAEPAGHVTVVTKDGRHGGTLSVDHVEVETAAGGAARPVNVPLADVSSVQLGDGGADVVRMREGKVVKGKVRVDGWTLNEADMARPLARGDLQFLVPQTELGTPRRGQTTDAATANGMIYHVRVPEKYDAKAGGPAIVVLHGSNANSADYLIGIAQRWPKVAADYVLIGIDGEWPTQKDPDGPPAYVYTYVNFVGKSKYKGFPGTDRESPALVAEAVAEIKGQLKLTKVFVTGHSQGGFLAYSCLMNYPEVFAGAMPIAAGLIFQCEPTAYEDAAIRALQRKRPIAIVHGERDPLVPVATARAAHASFLDDGFPMLRLLVAPESPHAFISLPFEEGVRWMESMTSDDPRALLKFAQQALARREYRDALAYLRRAQEVDSPGSQAAAVKGLRQRIEQIAATPAKTLQARIQAAKDNGWVDDFDAFRQQFEFTDAAAGVMAEYARLRKVHEPLAEKLWADARRAFKEGDQAQGYRACAEIVSSYCASSYYRYAKQTLAERR